MDFYVESGASRGLNLKLYMKKRFGFALLNFKLDEYLEPQFFNRSQRMTMDHQIHNSALGKYRLAALIPGSESTGYTASISTTSPYCRTNFQGYKHPKHPSRTLQQYPQSLTGSRQAPDILTIQNNRDLSLTLKSPTPNCSQTQTKIGNLKAS